MVIFHEVLRPNRIYLINLNPLIDNANVTNVIIKETFRKLKISKINNPKRFSPVTPIEVNSIVSILYLPLLMIQFRIITLG